jgi:hypothetical protein
VNASRGAILLLLSISAGHDLRAQTAGVALPETSAPPGWNRGFGLQRADGELWGIGPGYKARFTAGGIEITPVMGPAAPRSFPLAFALESVRRGDSAIYEAPAQGVVPSEEGPVARYERDLFVERYEVRPDGVELSFRFDFLPPGTGDLVVRGRVTTELLAPAVDAAREGILFEVEGLGGVSIGAVTGIDAEGNRASGWLRFDGTHLDLVLPGSFVGEAVFPLVLDPLIGPTVPITGGYDLDPDVAYDATYDVYLVVWERTFSSTNHDILGQRISSTGALVGGTIAISTTYDSANPVAANVGNQDKFVVAYQVWGSTPGFTQVLIRSVNAINGNPGIEDVILSDPAQTAVNFDVGGSTISNYAIVVTDDSTGGVSMVRFNLFTNQTEPFVTIAGSSSYNPAITKHGGGVDLFLVVWEAGIPGGQKNLWGRLVSGSGGIASFAQPISMDSVSDEENPDCATSDGTQFMVVYEKQPGGTTGHNDVACRAVTFNPGAPGTLSVSNESLLASGSSFDQVSPAVDFAKTKYLVAYATRIMLGSASFNIFAMGVDPNGCVPCEPAVPVDTSSTIDNFPDIAARFSGGAAGDEAMLVWQSISATDGEVKAQRLEAIGAGGAVVDLGGGCGAGGTITVNGPVALGNSSFAYGLSGAGGSPVALVLSPTLGNLSCGPCTLKPGFDIVLAVPAPFLSPTPCSLALYGATLYAQWIVATPGGCPIAPPLALSSAISVTIGT